MQKTKVPAIDGWFTVPDGPDGGEGPDTPGPALLGTRCAACGTVFFPRESFACRNPACMGRDLEEVQLSRTGRVWSFTNNCYQPPPPYVPPAGGFEPFTIAAVELAAEQIVVLGQVVGGVGIDELRAGMEVELVIDTLFEDDDNEYLIWKWRPVTSAGAAAGGSSGEGV